MLVISTFIYMRYTLLLIYTVVYSELHNKVDKTVVRGLFYAMACWLMTNILAAYAVYFDNNIMGVLSAIFQAVLMLVVILLFSRWLRTIAEKQKAFFVQRMGYWHL